ncbi:S1 RNA-binding domain-containing protein [bacterium]|nr:S1 RNA-binding domain-containing protein [bacterium]
MDIVANDVVQGRVAEVRDFGAFVWLEDGRKGLIHISEISDDYVKDIHNRIKPNQRVKVKVLSVKDDGRIELSLKQAESLDYTKPPRQEREHSHLPATEYLGEPPNINFEEPLVNSEEFDIMLKSFKRQSEENLLDNKRGVERKRAGGDKKKAKKRRGR